MSVNFILQGKGGVGKSFAAVILAQYLLAQGKNVSCIDTDPVNNTFASFDDLSVSYIPVIEGNEINSKKFDLMMETIAENIDYDFIVDNGASTFVPMNAYLLESGAYQMLIDMGTQVNVHTIITGGQALADTLNGFKTLCENTPEEVNLIVWLNPFFGRIESGSQKFSDFKIYKSWKDRVSGIVSLKERNRTTFGDDVRLMLEAKMTFDQAINYDKFGVMSKQRLKMVKNELFEALDLGLTGV